MRRLSSPEMYSNSNDILTYMFLFRKLREIFPDYRTEGFELRTIIMAETMANTLPPTSNSMISLSLIYYMACMIKKSNQTLKKNLLLFMVRRYFLVQRDKI